MDVFITGFKSLLREYARGILSIWCSWINNQMLCEVVLQQHNISIYWENVFMLLFEIIFQTTPVHLIKMSCFFLEYCNKVQKIETVINSNICQLNKDKNDKSKNHSFLNENCENSH